MMTDDDKRVEALLQWPATNGQGDGLSSAYVAALLKLAAARIEALKPHAPDALWRPFETAPRDRSDFVALIPRMGRRPSGRHHAWRAVDCYWERGLREPRFIWDGWRTSDATPVLWAPLPAALKGEHEPCHGPDDAWCPSCGLGGERP